MTVIEEKKLYNPYYSMYVKRKVSHLQLIWLMGQSKILSHFLFGRREDAFSVLESCVIRDGVSQMMMEIPFFLMLSAMPLISAP